MVIRFDRFRFEVASGLLYRDDAQVALPPRVILLLQMLVEQPGALVSRQELVAGVWRGVSVTETSLAEAVSQLRQGLGDNPQRPRFIETLHRRGYRFMADVVVQPEPARPPPHITAAAPRADLAGNGSSRSLQERFSPDGLCFGCGPANAQGLRLRSLPDGDGLVADWTPAAHHEAFPGLLNGGVIGALLDCHSNWAAAWRFMQLDGSLVPPCTVTAEYAVTLRRPTPSREPVHLRAWVVSVDGRRAIVESTLDAADRTCATCRGTFVAVEPDHPAFHRGPVPEP